MKVCSIGVWNETIPGITFDENGVSNFCRLQQTMMNDYPRGEKGKQAWDALVKVIKKEGSGRRYNCLIGVSGGVDSSNLLHIAHEYGLRPLAVNLDNGFSSEIAVHNIFRMTSQLGIDLETYVIDYEEIKDLLRAYMRAGVPWIDTPTDLAIKATMYKIANQEGIRYILRGNDFRSEGKQPKEWTYSDAKQLAIIHDKFGSGVKLKTYPSHTLFQMIYAGIFKGIKDVRPYYYLDYNKQIAKAMLMEQYGWKDYGGHHHENLFTKFAMSYWLPKKFGIDKRQINLSAQVLAGAITRAEALNQLNQPFGSDTELEQMRLYTLKKLDITEEEFVRIWNSPPKSPFDYPSDYKMIFWLADNFAPLLKKIYAYTPMSVTAKKVIEQSS